MRFPVLVTLLVALVFFLVIPGAGALAVRRRWRRFRSRVHKATCALPVSYATIHTRRMVHEQELVRVCGVLESIQGEHTIWVRTDDLSVAVDMSMSDVYLLARESEPPLAEPPLRTSWKRLGSISEGARVLVSGLLDGSGETPVIRASGRSPVLAIFYDGPLSTLVRRCVWSGRQLNEYWNAATPAALAGGTLALVILAYLILRGPTDRLVAMLTIGLATMPVLPLLPPGVVLFYVYRRVWRRGRILRAFRDVLQLPDLFACTPEVDGLTASATGESYAAGRDRRVDRRSTAGAYTGRRVSADELERHRSAGVYVIEPPFIKRGGSAFVFTGSSVDGPDDLSEPLGTTDDPHRQSQECGKLARRYEMLSAVVLVTAVVANLTLFLVVVGVFL